jgi:hypothetical protein
MSVPLSKYFLVITIILLSAKAQSTPIAGVFKEIATSYRLDDIQVSNPGEPRTYKTTLINSKDQRINILLSGGVVSIVGHDNDEFVILVNDDKLPSGQSNVPEPVAKPLENNTGLGFTIVKKGSILTLTQVSADPGVVKIIVPNKTSVNYREGGDGGQVLTMRDLKGEVEVIMKGSNVFLANITGPLIANSSAGNLRVLFSTLNQIKPSAVSTTHGNIDITLPSSAKANLKLRSFKEKIDADFVITPDGSERIRVPGAPGGQVLIGSINGGGVEISSTTANGKIFIRKAK